MRELKRIKVIKAVVDRRLRCYQVAKRLDACTRQISRLCRRYEVCGPVSR
jgi:hypothetical protein